MFNWITPVVFLDNQTQSVDECVCYSNNYEQIFGTGVFLNKKLMKLILIAWYSSAPLREMVSTSWFFFAYSWMKMPIWWQSTDKWDRLWFDVEIQYKNKLWWHGWNHLVGHHNTSVIIYKNQVSGFLQQEKYQRITVTDMQQHFKTSKNEPCHFADSTQSDIFITTYSIFQTQRTIHWLGASSCCLALFCLASSYFVRVWGYISMYHDLKNMNIHFILCTYKLFLKDTVQTH